MVTDKTAVNNLVYSIALIWASMDGKCEKFLAQKDPNHPERLIDGTYEGYMAEAAYVVEELEAEGWKFNKG